MNYQIEKLKISQVSQFHRVFVELMSEGFEYTPKIKKYFITNRYTVANFKYWLKNDYKGVFVVLLRRVQPSRGLNPMQIIGFLVYDAPYGGVLLCRWLGVLKEYRGQGAGKMLVEQAVLEAKALGCHKVELAGQLKAKKFYEKCGFKMEGFREKSYFGQDQYLFGKVIGELEEERVINF